MNYFLVVRVRMMKTMLRSNTPGLELARRGRRKMNLKMRKMNHLLVWCVVSWYTLKLILILILTDLR